MIFITNDPVEDAENYFWEQNEWLSKRPVCDVCGYEVQEDHYYDINGRIFCSHCIDDCKAYID